MQPYQKPQNNSKYGFIKWIATAGIIAGVAVWGLSGGKQQVVPDATVPVKLASVEVKDVPYYIKGIGTVESLHGAEIRTQIDGELVAVHFTEGADVEKGTLLAEIDSRTIKAQLAQARAEKANAAAQLETAQQDAARYENLLKQNAIAKQAADQQVARVKQLQAQVDAANAAIESARVRLDYTKIVSPVSGRVGIRRIDPGNIVRTSDAQGIVKVTQIKPIAGIFSLPQAELPALQKAFSQGDVVVEAITRDGKEVIARGELQAIDSEINASSGTIRLKAMFPNDDEALWPGQLVALRLKADVRKDALVVPVRAVQIGAQGDSVFVVKGDVAEMVNVVRDFENEKEAVISEGLSAGDKVVVDGQVRLRSGSKIKVSGKNE